MDVGEGQNTLSGRWPVKVVITGTTASTICLCSLQIPGILHFIPASLLCSQCSSNGPLSTRFNGKARIFFFEAKGRSRDSALIRPGPTTSNPREKVFYSSFFPPIFSIRTTPGFLFPRGFCVFNDASPQRMLEDLISPASLHLIRCLN